MHMHTLPHSHTPSPHSPSTPPHAPLPPQLNEHIGVCA